MNKADIEEWMANPSEGSEAITGVQFRQLCELALRNMRAGFSVPQGEPVCPNCCTPWKCNGPHITESKGVMSEYWTAPLVPEAELAALRAELTEQCRLNGMGQEREARLMAQLQEAERKLAELMKEGRE